MTQDLHNLDEGIEDSFQFQLSGKKYSMKYPTTEEIQKSQDLKKEEDQMMFIYGLIKPLDDGAPIQEALKTANTKVLQRFNQMIKAEFSVED